MHIRSDASGPFVDFCFVADQPPSGLHLSESLQRVRLNELVITAVGPVRKLFDRAQQLLGHPKPVGKMADVISGHKRPLYRQGFVELGDRQAEGAADGP
jgi:hypothetical protein